MVVSPRRGDLVQHARIPGVVGRPHTERRRPRGRLDLRLGHVDLRSHPGCGECRQIRMAPRVVLDRISGRHQHLRELGVARHLVADLEEGRRHVVLLEHREHRRGVRARAVVEGEGDDLLPRRRPTAGRLRRGERRLTAVRRGLGRCRECAGGQRRHRHEQATEQPAERGQHFPFLPAPRPGDQHLPHRPQRTAS